MTLTSSIAIAIAATDIAANDLQSLRSTLAYNQTASFTNGTGNGQANILFADTRTLTASSTEDLTLTSSLIDSLGRTMTFTKVKAILVKAASANTNNVNVTRPASNGLVAFLAASDGVPVKPEGVFLLTAPNAGITVTGGTGDILTLTNSAGGTSVIYDVVIIGVGTLA